MTSGRISSASAWKRRRVTRPSRESNTQAHSRVYTQRSASKLSQFLDGATAFVLRPNAKGELHTLFIVDTRNKSVHMTCLRSWTNRGWIRRIHQPTRMQMYILTEQGKKEIQR